MGKKAVIISGMACIILVACLIPPILKHYRIEGLVRDLHSEDEEIWGDAIDGLTEYGDKVVPRLLREISSFPKLNDTEVRKFQLKGQEGKKRIFEIGAIKTFISIGEPSLPHLISNVSKSNNRLNCTVLTGILSVYGRLVFTKDLNSIGIRHRNSKVKHFHTQLITYPTEYFLYQGGFDNNKSPFYKTKIYIKPILESLCKERVLLMTKTNGLNEQQYRIKSKRIIQAACEALERLESQ